MLLENNPYPQDVRVRQEAESLVGAGHRVTVVAPRAAGQPGHEWVDGVEVRRFRLPDAGGSRSGFLLEYLVAAIALHLAALRALIAGATVLTIHNPPDILFAAGALFRFAGRRVVFDHHDLFPETVALKFGRGPAARLAARLATACERLTFASAHHVISTNGSYADVALGRGGKSSPEVTVVRNGPPRRWTDLPSDNRQGILDGVELVYVGTVAAQDGVEGISPILARLRGALDAHLTIIGDGDARPALEAALMRDGVADRVTFTGWVAPAAVPDLIRAADICVDPTPATDVNRRSTMIKLAEYLSLGKPVVAYDLLEARRTAGDAARLVAPGDVDAFADEIVRLAREPEARLLLATRARRRAAELTWDHSERALLQVYNGLRSKRG
jgi:glycosyltransferase involved in cell wall biosynthesis